MQAAKLILQSLPEWASEIPYALKKFAVNEAYQAFYSGCKKARASGAPFQLHFRSRKDPKQSCFIPHSSVHALGVYPRIAKELRLSEALPDNCKDSRLVCQSGRWYLVVPFAVKVGSSDNQGRVVALDPGVRTFITGYSEYSAFKIGEADFSRIQRLCAHLDRLRSKVATSKSRKRYSLKKAMKRMQWKIWDLVDELHWKTIRFLTENFDLILLPTFETSQMVNKSHRKIRSKTVRSMLTFAHFKFKQRLKYKAGLLGKTVLDVNEAYTSKTASWTGEVKKIGGSKRITSGGFTVDRDLNGARGIFLRALVDTPSLVKECA